jgi:hypothetical protein
MMLIHDNHHGMVVLVVLLMKSYPQRLTRIDQLVVISTVIDWLKLQ